MSDKFKQSGITLNGNKNQQKTDCPSCGGNKTLSVNIGLGLYHCFSCNLKGRIE